MSFVTRSRLKDIQDQLREVRARKGEAEAEGRRLANNDAPDHQIIAKAKEIAAVRGEEAELARREREMITGLGDHQAGVGGGYGESLFADLAVQQTMQRIAHDPTTPVGTVDLGELYSAEEVRAGIRSGRFEPGMHADVSTGGVVDTGLPTDPARTGPFYGPVAQLRRRLVVLAAIPTATMTSGSFSYALEAGSFDGAVETAEQATSPAGELDTDDATVEARTIRVFLKMGREQAADSPWLQTTAESRLMYSCLRRLEGQILAGDGVGQNIKGILATTGIGSVAYDAAVPLSDLPLDAITSVLQSDAVPDLAVFNPVDLAKMMKALAAGSGERLDTGGAFAGTSDTIWSLPRVASNAIPAGTALVGDFAFGATVFIREGVSVRASDSDQDDFLKNRLSLIAVLRAGLAVWRPSCFTEVHLA